jgi:hypothetical protein
MSKNFTYDPNYRPRPIDPSRYETITSDKVLHTVYLESRGQFVTFEELLNEAISKGEQPGRGYAGMLAELAVSHLRDRARCDLSKEFPAGVVWL